MKKALGILLSAVLAASVFAGCTAQNTGSESSDSSAEAQKLIVATEAGFAPYEYLVGNEVEGVDMDIAQAVADELGRTLEIQNMDFDAALIAVQQGKVDFAAAGISVSPERQEVMDFSTNYVDSTEVVVVNEADPAVSEATGDGLKDKTVAVQQGNIADLWCSNSENASPKEVKRYTKFALAAEDLKAGKVDCIVMDELPAKDLVKANPELTILKGDPLFTDQYAIAVQKGNSELLESINKVIEQLKADGKINEFIANHSDSVK